MGAVFHVSSRRNRESIAENGLDWRFMSDVPGIAGSSAPEVAGVFLCRDRSEADYFVDMNNTGGPVDVWEVAGIDVEQLIDAGSGYRYLPRPVRASSVLLDSIDHGPSVSAEHQDLGTSEAYTSILTITFDVRRASVDRLLSIDRGHRADPLKPSTAVSNTSAAPPSGSAT